MQAAARLGISHTEFLGWPEHDRHIMIALGRVERLTGPNGEWLPEATSERADPNNYDDPLRYTVSGPFTNWAEKARRDAEDTYRKAAGENANMNGMFWTVDAAEPPA